jgi:hypothetical protein
MFCPNCGKNCGNDRFCSSCGTKLNQDAEQSSAWTAEQPCPKCRGTKWEGDRCAFCGAQRNCDSPKTELAIEDSYEIPFRRYRAVLAWIQLAKEELVIEKDGLLGKSVYRIPYTQLSEVVFSRNEELHGIMEFVWNKAAQAFSSTHNPVNLDKVTIKLGAEEDCAYFFHIFYLIKLLAPSTVRFVTRFALADIECLNRYSRNIDLNSYFSRFNPYRVQAVSALSREHIISEKEARALIDALFNKCQQELYEAEPLLAARDYNRMIAERYQRYEKEKLERHERGVKRYRR